MSSNNISNSANNNTTTTGTKGKWVPPSIKRDAFTPQERTNVIFRKVRGILNKITPEKFNKLSEELLQLGLNSPQLLKGVILLIFEKALEEPKYSSMYAQLCKKLSEEVPNFEPITNSSSLNTLSNSSSNSSTLGHKNTFCRLLLAKCRDEFENRNKAYSEKYEKKNEVLTADEEEQRALTKYKMLGNIKFICELGKANLVNESILHTCIKSLCKSNKNETIQNKAEDLECLCQIMKTVGRLLDTEKAKSLMDQYFDRMLKYSTLPEMPSRIKFMLQDILDLRSNKWVPRRVQREQAPKTIVQIRQEAAKDMGFSLHNYSSYNHPILGPSGQGMFGPLGPGRGPGDYSLGHYGPLTPQEISLNMRRYNQGYDGPVGGHFPSGQRALDEMYSTGLNPYAPLGTGPNGVMNEPNMNIRNMNMYNLPVNRRPTVNPYTGFPMPPPNMSHPNSPNDLMSNSRGNYMNNNMSNGNNHYNQYNNNNNQPYQYRGSHSQEKHNKYNNNNNNMNMNMNNKMNNNKMDNNIRSGSHPMVNSNNVPNQLPPQGNQQQMVNSQGNRELPPRFLKQLEQQQINNNQNNPNHNNNVNLNNNANLPHLMNNNPNMIPPSIPTNKHIIHKPEHKKIDPTEISLRPPQNSILSKHTPDFQQNNTPLINNINKNLPFDMVNPLNNSLNKPFGQREIVIPNSTVIDPPLKPTSKVNPVAPPPIVSGPPLLKPLNPIRNINVINNEKNTEIIYSEKPIQPPNKEKDKEKEKLEKEKAEKEKEELMNQAIKENIIKKTEETLNEYLKEKKTIDEVIEQMKELKIPKNFQTDVLVTVMKDCLDKTDTDRASASKFLTQLKNDNVIQQSVYMSAFKSIINQMSDLENDVPRIKTYISVYIAKGIVDGVVTLKDAYELVGGASKYPLFLLSLQQLTNLKEEPWIYEKFNESKIDLMLTLPEIDRRKERLVDILKDRGLSFLYPLLRIESDLAKQLSPDSSNSVTPTSLYKWIKENVPSNLQHSTGFVNIFTNLMIKFIVERAKQLSENNEKDKNIDKSEDNSENKENDDGGKTEENGNEVKEENKDVEEKNKQNKKEKKVDYEKQILSKYAVIFISLLNEKPKLQLITLYTIQSYCHSIGFPKGYLLKWFVMFYQLEIVEEEVFFKWKEDIKTEYPGKEKALFEVHPWLRWLEEAEEEEEDEEEEEEK